jgi:hypothetical protein
LSQNFTLFFFSGKFSLLFRFVFALFHFRFASDAKTSEKTLFLHQSEKISLPLRFDAKKMAVFRFCFTSFCFKAKIMAVFRFRLALFRFKAKMMAVFCLFFVLFSLRSIFVPL